ncbi:hypothetical protein [Paraburkholderia sacchari]
MGSQSNFRANGRQSIESITTITITIMVMNMPIIMALRSAHPRL